MVLNVFFFSDESMHKLYVNYGKYDIIQQIPQILYSTIITKLSEIFLCYLCMTDKPIYQIKNLMVNNSLTNMKFIYKCINIKLIIFFIFTFIFMLFYWYVIIYLIPSALRICAIKNRNRKCSIFVYKLSEIIPFF